VTRELNPTARSDRRSDCPIACSLDLIGDRWTLLIVRDLFRGKRRFSEFLASDEGIKTNSGLPIRSIRRATTTTSPVRGETCLRS
jgi:hypothetical protein